MTVLEFIGSVFTYFSVEDFRKKFSANRTSKRGWYQLAKTNIENIRTGTIRELADHFTEGNIESFKKLIKDCRKNDRVIVDRELRSTPERPEERD